VHKVTTTTKLTNSDVYSPTVYIYFLKCALDLVESGASLGKSVSSLGKSVTSLVKDAPFFIVFIWIATQC
jgi:hypothetical protein